MEKSIIIRNLTVESHCGVTQEERLHTQPLYIDLEVTHDTTHTIENDDLKETLDYEIVCAIVKKVTQTEHCALLETLATKIVKCTFDNTSAKEIFITITKRFDKTVPKTAAKKGITIKTTRQDFFQNDQPSTLLTRYLPTVSRGRALDIAAGKGRNSLFLAQAGFEVEAIDRDNDALLFCERRATQLGLQNITLRQIDLEKFSPIKPQTYDLIVNTYYLQRDLAPIIIDALKVGGTLIFQTFLIENHFRFQHPRRTEFCLKPNELLKLFQNLSIIYYHEGITGSGPYLASMVAKKII